MLDTNGKTILHLIINFDGTELRNVRISEDGTTLLHWIAEKGNTEAYKKVAIESGVVNPKKHANNETPEIVATKNFHLVLLLSL